MQYKSALFVKTALVFLVLFVLEPGVADQTQPEDAHQSQCCGMRSLRELFRCSTSDDAASGDNGASYSLQSECSNDLCPQAIKHISPF